VKGRIIDTLTDTFNAYGLRQYVMSRLEEITSWMS